MVYSVVTPAKQSYLLWRRFTMPTSSGTKDAIAVSASDGDKLVSAYTFILEHIIMLVWGIAVLIVVLISIRQYGHDHPSSPISTQIYSKRSSPFVVLQLALRNFLQIKSIRLLISVWIAIAVAFLTVKYAIPIIFSGYIDIGNAAPVNVSAVFVPSRNNTGSFSDASNINNLEIFNFYVPWALRAVANVDNLNDTADLNPPLSVDQPETIGVNDNGELIMRIGYRYNATGLDFGLQFYPDLLLSVEGSCITEYDWWAGESSSNPSYPGAYVEAYIPFNNPNDTKYVSLYDGGPRAFFYANPPAASSTNSTWAAIISSVNRTSWFPSTDPWYQTGPNPFYGSNQTEIAPYMVASQRPALSCWENDVWSYRGHSGSITDLQQLPGLDLSPGLNTILVDSLGLPMIYLLGTYLQVSALKSSVTALSNILDASSSSIYSDLSRLVYASYIATINCLTETTLFPQADGFLNGVAPGGILLEGTGDFVIYSSDIVTLSVRTLIIIPTIAVGLWIISIVLLLLPNTRQAVTALKRPAGVNDKEETQQSRAMKMAGTVFTEALSLAESDIKE